MWTLAPSVSGLPRPLPHVGAIDEKTLEDTGAAVSPLVKAYTEMRETIFKIADEIGIGNEVRTVYYDVATGARAGQAFGAILTAGVNPESVAISALSGGAGSGGAAAIGMSVGTVIGAAVAVISFLASDDDDAELRKKHHEEFRAYTLGQMQRRMTLDDLIKEQVELAHVTRTFYIPAQPKHKAELEKAAATSDKIALFYKRLKEELPPLQREIFVSVTNLVRWSNYQAELEAALASPNPVMASMASKLGLGDVAANIQNLRDTESKNLEALTEKAASGKIAIQMPNSNGAAWIYLAAAGALIGAGLYFYPGQALSLYRRAVGYARPALSGAKSLGHKALSKVGM